MVGFGYRKSTLHAIAAMDALARAYRTAQPRLTAAQLAQISGIKHTSIAKDLIPLERHGLVKALPGRGGGYELSRPPEQIKLTDVLQACGEQINDLPSPLEDEPCDCPSLQRLWHLRQSMFALINQISISDYATGT